MKSLHLFIILILLILVIYYYNKSAVYEKVEHFNDNIINQLASIMNGDTVKLKNIELTGTLTAPNITTRILKSTKANGDYIDFDTNIFSPNNNLLGTISSGNEASGRKKIIVNNNIDFNGDVNVNNNKTLNSKNLKTYNITSTNGENSWVDVKSNINLYKTLKYQGNFITGKNELMAGKKNFLSW